MPPEALWITKNRIDSASDGIDGGTGCNFIFMYLFMYLFLLRRCPGHAILYFLIGLSNVHLRLRFLI